MGGGGEPRCTGGTAGSPPPARRVQTPPEQQDYFSTGPEALECALRYLNRRDRTVAEVRGRLERAEVEGEDIDAAIDELTELGFLDDARYARLFAEDRRKLDDWGNARIERTLHERGVDSELIAAALAHTSVEDERERALTVLRSRYPQPSHEARELERALGVLIRKGYDSALAYDAVRAWSAGAS